MPTGTSAVPRRKPLRLNLGCGPEHLKGWVNIDSNPEERPDLVADVTDLSMFADDSVDEIYASHILEHIDVRVPALAEWARVLRPGGVITVVVPDVIATFFAVRRGGYYAGMPSQRVPCDEVWLNATVFGGWMIYPQFADNIGHIHRQVFLFDELEYRMLPLFQNVKRVGHCSVREATMGEMMVEGLKPSPINAVRR